MRNRKDVRKSNRHNETKLLILKALARPMCWLTSEDIANICNLAPNNTSRQLTKLVGQGYIWRRDIGKKSYRYRHLKRMGERVLRKLWIRDRLIQETKDSRIDLNLKHNVPSEYITLQHKIEEKFNFWIFSSRET